MRLAKAVELTWCFEPANKTIRRTSVARCTTDCGHLAIIDEAGDPVVIARLAKGKMNRGFQGR
ncbi:MAG: hypothetical protein SVV67_03985 [Bacillota bacterium]|nr:hypothetical protein [Bacillota bacterium]